jgi:hypothetical protein
VQFVERPDLQNGLAAQIFGDGDKQRCALDLPYVGDASSIVRLP